MELIIALLIIGFLIAVLEKTNFIDGTIKFIIYGLVLLGVAIYLLRHFAGYLNF